MTHDEGRRDIVAALSRGLEVLRHCAASPEGLTLAQTARRTGYTRATVRRSLLTLAEAGYLLEQERLFVPTPKILSLAAPMLAASPARLAQPVLDGLSRRLGESVSVARLEGSEIVYVARAEARRIMALDLSVGSRLPAFCTSMGRVLLASLPDAALQECLSMNFAPRTPRTVTDPAALRAILAEVRAAGFCIVDGELELGLRSLAVPVTGARGHVSAALNVSTQSARTKLGELRRTMLPALREAATSLAPVFA